MGCWNETCGVSQLPIRDGDKVALFLLEPKREELTGGLNGFTYNTDLFSPVSIPLFGEYNDYGSLENIDQNGEYVFHYLHEKDKRLHGGVTQSFRTVKEYIDLIERGKFGNLQFMMVHADIYYALIDEVGSRFPYNEKKTIKEQFIDQANACLEQYKQAEKKDEWERELFFNFKLKDLNGFSRFYSSYELKLSSWLDLVVKKQEEQLLSEMTDLRLFFMAMNLGRKMWMPQGVKSQIQDYMVQRVIAEKVLEKEEEQKRRYIEQNEMDLSKEEDRDDYENCTRETIWL